MFMYPRVSQIAPRAHTVLVASLTAGQPPATRRFVDDPAGSRPVARGELPVRPSGKVH